MAVTVQVLPVSFAIESGAPEVVGLRHRDGSPITRTSKSSQADVDRAARSLLRTTLEAIGKSHVSPAADQARDDLIALSSRFMTVAGTQRDATSVALVYTCPLPIPLAESELDVTLGSPYHWKTLNSSKQKAASRSVPEQRRGANALVLDYWRQAFEETDAALDFLPHHFSLLQLRSLYDAVWGYEQDSSGFKRWAIDRTGAFAGLLDDVADPRQVDHAVFESLGRKLPPTSAAQAGAVTAGRLVDIDDSLRLPVAMTAALTGNRLFKRRGPEPKWFTKAEGWRHGPTWIENVYPPRPDWTMWDAGNADTPGLGIY